MKKLKRGSTFAGRFDVVEEIGTHYITMEYVAGEDLKSFIRRAGLLSVEKAISLAKQVCEGLAEELINALAQIKDLRIVARSSSFSFKGKDADIRDIGRTLNVGAVLEGSIQKAGNHLRITAQLINVSDGYHLWSERFDRTMDNIFAIQDEISMAVVDKLKGELLEEDREKITKRYTAG
jgi:TolB-like protein